MGLSCLGNLFELHPGLFDLGVEFGGDLGEQVLPTARGL
jgi:hypothetical protein